MYVGIIEKYNKTRSRAGKTAQLVDFLPIACMWSEVKSGTVAHICNPVQVR